jgi:hypothetical protein
MVMDGILKDYIAFTKQSDFTSKRFISHSCAKIRSYVYRYVIFATKIWKKAAIRLVIDTVMHVQSPDLSS